MRKQKIDGAITVPMLLACVTLAIASLGTWGVLRHWRFLMETQIRLDRCTREAALALKETQQLIERTNLAIHAARLVVLAGVLDPPALAAARATLAILVLKQDAALLIWRGKQATWLLPGHCGSWVDIRPPLPGLGWTRPPPDPLGPLPLYWEGMPQDFVIRASRRPRHSVAEISRSRNRGKKRENAVEIENEPPLTSEWSARWTAPL